MNTKKKELGQFFTSPIIADFMSKLVYFDSAKTVLDPAVGEGVFLKYIDINKKNVYNEYIGDNKVLSCKITYEGICKKCLEEEN